MQLLIDTTERETIKLVLLDGKKVIASRQKHTREISETLLTEIGKLLGRHKINLQDLEKILVNPGPGGFSATRTGVATANALNFVSGSRTIVLPVYDKAPNITRPKLTT